MVSLYRVEYSSDTTYNVRSKDRSDRVQEMYVLADSPLSAAFKAGALASRWKFEGGSFYEVTLEDSVVISSVEVSDDYEGKKFVMRHPHSNIAYYWDVLNNEWTPDLQKATVLTPFLADKFPPEGNLSALFQ